MTIPELLSQIKPDQAIIIDAKPHIVKSKTRYTIAEDHNATYYKCVLDDHQALVIIPSDELIYLGGVIPDLDYRRISDDEIEYDNQIFHYTGAGHQIVTEIVFGDPKDTEGECDFEDYESATRVISLGILQNGKRADVYAKKINLENVEF